MSKRIISSILVLIFGFSLMIFGVVGLFDLKPVSPMTDKEIIQRAKALGMRDLKEQIETEAQPETKTESKTEVTTEVTTEGKTE